MDIDFSSLSRSRLLDMSRAGDQVLESFRVLGKGGANVVSQVLKQQDTFYEMDHYPPGDVYDDESHAQYYYHAHRPDTQEHGHFHTFLRAKAIPAEIAPYPVSCDAERPTGDDAICHLIAISMDRSGLPIRLFATNRWVTDETFYRAGDVIALLDRFSIDHVHPCLATNQWLTAMVRLFRPQIEELLRARDAKLLGLENANPEADVFEDRDVEVTSSLEIDIDLQIEQVDGALAERHGNQISEGVNPPDDQSRSNG